MTNPPPPGYTPAPTASAAGAGAGNPAGRIALIFAIVSVAFGLVQRIVTVFLPTIMMQTATSYSSIGIIFSVLAVISILISAGALAFGWYGATRRGLPHLTSGIGLGIGAAGVISGLVGLVAAPMAGLLL